MAQTQTRASDKLSIFRTTCASLAGPLVDFRMRAHICMLDFVCLPYRGVTVVVVVVMLLCILIQSGHVRIHTVPNRESVKLSFLFDNNNKYDEPFQRCWSSISYRWMRRATHTFESNLTERSAVISSRHGPTENA